MRSWRRGHLARAGPGWPSSPSKSVAALLAPGHVRRLRPAKRLHGLVDCDVFTTVKVSTGLRTAHKLLTSCSQAAGLHARQTACRKPPSGKEGRFRAGKSCQKPSVA